MRITEDDFKALLVRMYPDVEPLIERNLAKAAEATALHCFVYGFTGAGDAKILREVIQEYDKTGRLPRTWAPVVPVANGGEK